MATCQNYKCKREIPDGTKKCPHCQWVQKDRAAANPSVEIRGCKHCKGTGECTKGKIIKVRHSCEYCVSKSGIKTDNPFLTVPCGYCEGRGYHVIDLKKGKTWEKNKGKEKRGDKNGR